MADTEDDDEIGSALFGRRPPDLGPLVRLLRSDRPISSGIRDMLAEMLDPTKDGYLFVKLIIKDVEGKVKNSARDLQNLEIGAYHAQLVRSGKSSNQAAESTGEKFGMDARRVYSRLNEAKRYIKWLKGQSEDTTDKI